MIPLFKGVIRTKLDIQDSEQWWVMVQNISGKYHIDRMTNVFQVMKTKPSL